MKRLLITGLTGKSGSVFAECLAKGDILREYTIRAAVRPTSDTAKLQKLLPFQSLSLSTLTDRKGVFAMISKEENLDQPLQKRRPSVRSKLQKTQEATSPKISAKSKGQER